MLIAQTYVHYAHLAPSRTRRCLDCVCGTHMCGCASRLKYQHCGRATLRRRDSDGPSNQMSVKNLNLGCDTQGAVPKAYSTLMDTKKNLNLEA